jgi:hypothetical protein
MPAYVFHSKTLWNGFIDPPRWPSDYNYVAVVNVDSADEAFALTNSVETNWTQSSHVIAVRSDIRSTSVGDVVVVNGTAYRCEMVGWKVLG